MRIKPVEYLRYMILITCMFPIAEISGQYYNTGQDPSSISWKHIKTGKFDVIYPSGSDSLGIKFAGILDESYSCLTQLLPKGKLRIPVVIHNYSTRSNGYVAWAPRRMELYPAPDQNAIPGNQDRLLAIHETTHVMEMEALNTGFSGIMSFFLGEQFTGVLSAMLPFWYLEGNAVVSETLFSSSGRGRNPSFLQELKAIAVEHGNYSYDKILNGSFRNHVPDYYSSGSQMTAWAMAEYDPFIWNKVLSFTGQQPFTLNPVNISLRRNTGLTKKKLYEETFDTLQTLWTEDVKLTGETYTPVNIRAKEEYKNYYSPHKIGIDSIIAIKTSLSETPEIVLTSGGKEKILLHTGSIYPLQLSYGAGKVAWVESRPDLRWNNRDFMIIRVLDIKTGKTINISGKSRYLSAAISPDGSMIAAILNTPENVNKLVILDAVEGTAIISVQSPGNAAIQRPQWSADGKNITVIYLTEQGEGILAWSSDNKSWKILLSGDSNDIQSSFLRNDSLFFVSSGTGTDNILLKTPSEELFQLTHSRYGVKDVSFSKGVLLFSDYTVNGNDICTLNMPDNPDQIESKPDSLSFLTDRIDIQGIRETAPVNAAYHPESYSKTAHLFRFHSWMPFYADIDKIKSDPFSIRPGVTLMSQNILSTLVSTFSYEYSVDRRHLLHSGITWYGWYPVINARLDYGYSPSVIGASGVNIAPGMKFSGDISLPFYFSSGYFLHYLRITAYTDYSNNRYSAGDGTNDYGQTSITGRIYFSNYSRSAIRDIYPKWAQSIDLNRVFAPFDRDIFGSSIYIRTNFYFPGIFKNNGIRLRFENERQDQSRYIFGNRINSPRGFTAYPNGYSNITSDRLTFLSADYVFPVAYPDFNISSLIYLKRIRAGLFYDEARGEKNRYYVRNNQGGLELILYDESPLTFSSYGLQLLGDIHVLRIPFMISAGVEAAWRVQDKSPSISAIFNMDLYGFSIGRY